MSIGTPEQVRTKKLINSSQQPVPALCVLTPHHTYVIIIIILMIKTRQIQAFVMGFVIGRESEPKKEVR